MSGTKTIVNNTNRAVSITLNIRAGENPVNSAGIKQVLVGPGEQSVVTYGSDSNIYLNGLTVVAVQDGSVVSAVEYVGARGSSLDNLLNQNSVIEIGGTFVQLSARNG